MSNETSPDFTPEEELAALRTENEELRDQLEPAKTKGPLWRRVLAGVLAVLAVIAVVSAVQAVWVKTTLQDEDRFVSTFQSLPQNDAVASVLSIRITDGVIEATGVEAFVSDVLPDGLSFLVAPLTTAIQQRIAEVADDVIQSDTVTSAWAVTLRLTHKGVSAILSGNDQTLVADDGKVVLDLDEIAAVVVDRVEASGLDLPDLELSLGSVVLYESEDLAAAQTVARWITTMGWFLPLLALVLIALAIWASTNRHRLTQFLGFGTALALLLSLAGLRIARYATINGIEDEITQEAAASVWDTVLVRLIQATWALLLVLLIVGIIAWATGPSERAGRFAAWSSRTLDAWRRPVEEEPSGFTAFLVEWKRTIQVVIVVSGLLFVLFGPAPSGLLVIFTAAIVLALDVLVELLAGPERAPAKDLDSADV